MIKHFIGTDDEFVEMLDHLANYHWFYIFDATELCVLRVENKDIKLFQIFYEDPEKYNEEE